MFQFLNYVTNSVEFQNQLFIVTLGQYTFYVIKSHHDAKVI